MILNASETKSKSTLDNSSTFQIQSSSKAFKILSSNLYKDKISAVIREISTNAVDAHKAINLKRPISVHLPTLDNSAFIVEDFGVGMNEDEVMNLYTTYFGSSKTGSNDYVGALGLGSKSPFAYTDKFTIESAKDGLKNIFSCYLNEDEMPVVSKVGSFAVETTGTKVIIPVGRDDRRDFSNKATAIYRYFDQLPELNLESVSSEININNKFEEEKTVYKGKNYLIVKTRNYGQDAFEVVMGNIRYPVKVNESRVLSDHPLHGLLRNNNSLKVVIQIPIGTVDIAPSREELSYDKQSISNLYALFTEINDDVAKKLVKKVKSFTLGKDRIQFLYDNRSFLSNLGNQEEFKLDARAEDIFVDDTKVFELRGRSNTGRLHTVDPISLSSLEIARVWYPESTKLVMDEVTLRKSGMKSRILKKMREDRVRRIIIVDPKDLKKNRFFVDGCKFITIEDLPEKDKVARSKSAGYPVPIRTFGMGDKTLDTIGKQVYYLKAVKSELPTLKKFADGDKPTTGLGNIRRLLESMSKPVVIFSSTDMYRFQRRIAKDSSLIELTPEKIDSNIKRKVSKRIKDNMGTIETMMVLGNGSIYGMFEGRGIVGDNSSTLNDVVSSLRYVSDEDREKLMKVPMFKAICEVYKSYAKYNKDITDFRSQFESHERVVAKEIIGKKIKNLKANEGLVKEVESFKKLQTKVNSNMLIKGYLNFVSYWGSEKIAKTLVDSFVNF